MKSFQIKLINHNGPLFPRIITNILFGFALLIILTFNLFSFNQAAKFASSNQWVIHTYQVLQSVNNIFLNLIQIESQTRGMLVTNNQSIYPEIKKTENLMYQYLDATKQLTQDNPAQQKNLVLLESMVRVRIDLIQKLMQAAQTNDKKLAKTIIIQGEELTKKISFLIHDISNQELLLLNQRNSSSLDNLKDLNYILFLTSIVSAIIIILGIILLHINLSRKEKYLHEKRKYEYLLVNIIDGTSDLIVALNLNFEFMIFNHSYEREFKAIYGKRPQNGVSIIDTLAHLPESQKKIERLWTRALQGDEFSLVIDFGESTDNKNTNIYECSFNSIYDEYGVLIGASGICRNINHRIETEKFLKNTNEQLEHAYDELKHHDYEVTLLNEMENNLQSCQTINETLLIFTKYSQKLLPFASGVIYLVNPSRNYLEVAAEWNSPHVTEQVFSPNQCWALRQGKNYNYIANTTSIICEHMHKQDSVSYLCVPLLAQNDVIGLLNIAVTDSQNYSEVQMTELFNKHELLMKNLAVQLALAIANIQLRDILKTRIYT